MNKALSINSEFTMLILYPEFFPKVLKEVFSNIFAGGGFTKNNPNVSYVSFNYKMYDKLSEHLVNKTDKRVFSLMKHKRIIVYDLNEFWTKRDDIQQKVSQIEKNIGKV